MNSKDFNELVEARCRKIKATLASKGKEYSTNDDKLHNFNKAGIRSGQSREKALMGMKLKHEISIDDIILNLDKGILPTIEVIDEKIGDIINYFVLLEACLVDRMRKSERKYPLTSEECFKVEENPSKFLEGQIYTWNGSSTGIKYKLIAINEHDVVLEQVTNRMCIYPGIKTFKENYTLWKEGS